MSPILLFITALSCGWLVWSLWYKASPAKRLPGIPLVEFDGDNSREHYTSDAASLVGKGYEMVEPFIAISLQPCYWHKTHLNSIHVMADHFLYGIS